MTRKKRFILNYKITQRNYERFRKTHDFYAIVVPKWKSIVLTTLTFSICCKSPYEDVLFVNFIGNFLLHFHSW